MSVATIVAVLGFVVMFLLNIGGWVWFFATLTARVAAIEARLVSQQATLNALPKDYVPREQIDEMRRGIEHAIRGQAQAVTDLATEIRTLTQHLLAKA